MDIFLDLFLFEYLLKVQVLCPGHTTQLSGLSFLRLD